MTPDEQDHQLLLTHCFLSYRMLKEVLESSNITDNEEAVMVTRMRVDPRHVDEFERLLRLILKNTHTIGHVSTCVVKPPPGEFTYTSIVKYSSLQAMRQIYPSTVESGVDFYKLIAARDSLLLEPPTYQIEAGFGTWIESDGNTKPMRGDDPEEDDNMVYQNVPGPCCNDSCENPHGLNVRASFVVPTKNFQLFQTRYQRNNKKGGQKNLRCFPSCRNGRHVSSGFCGDSIRVHVGISRVTESGGVKFCPIQQSNQPIVLTFARFVNLDGAFDQTVSGPDVFPGQTIDKSDVLAWVRDKEHPMNPLFPGILRGAAMETASQSAIFEFNSECKAWHYGWTAPRGQGLSGSDAQHVLEILFMKPMGAYMYCLERLRSDGFSIYSSRRASHAAIKPEAEPFENGEDDDRSVKRKRTQVPPSPAGTISSAASDSPLASPEKEDSWNRAASTTTSEALITDVTASLEQQTFKSEPTAAQALPSSSFTSVNCPMSSGFDTPSNFSMLLNSGNGMQTQQQQQLHQQLQSQMNSLPEGEMHSYLPQHYPSGDLMSHTLFNDMQPPRRVVASEELPWSELYNLFDSVPPLAMVASDEDPDRDCDSPGSTPSSGGYGDDDDIALQTNAFTHPPPPLSSQAVLNYL
ncbi:hypothetical protein FI667_g6652, partial [Globisporangium splendens]